MTIKKHKICDLCGQSVGVNRRYYTIKSKVLYVASGGSTTDNKRIHICEDCMRKLANAVLEKEDDGDNDN